MKKLMFVLLLSLPAFAQVNGQKIVGSGITVGETTACFGSDSGMHCYTVDSQGRVVMVPLNPRNVAELMPLVVGAPPHSGLAAAVQNTPAGGHSVALTCTPPTSGDTPDSYQFSRGTATGGPYSVISNPNPTACAYTDTDPLLLSGKTFFYIAKSVKQTQTSGPSNEVTATLPFLLNPPTLQTPVVQ